MADTFTQFLNLVRPEVGASFDLWGTKWNTNADKLDIWSKATAEKVQALIDRAESSVGSLADALSKVATANQNVVGPVAFNGKVDMNGEFNVAGTLKVGGQPLDLSGFVTASVLTNYFDRRIANITVGDVEIQKANPRLFLNNPSSGRLGITVDANGAWQVINNSGQVLFAVSASGAIGTPSMGNVEGFINNAVSGAVTTAANYATNAANARVALCRMGGAVDRVFASNDLTERSGPSSVVTEIANVGGTFMYRSRQLQYQLGTGAVANF